MTSTDAPHLDRPHADHPIALEFPATIAVIGGGPIGLEATLYGRFLGYEVTLFEQGEVAENVRQWQHTPMWTPFQLLHSRLGRLAIETQNPAQRFPEPLQEISAREWLESYVLPLAGTDLITKSLRTRHRVLSVGRCHYAKQQVIANETRWQDGFVVVWQDAEGNEHSDTFDFVIDASGTFHQQQSWGVGGSMALGESRLRSARVQDPELGAALHVTAPDFAKDPGHWENSGVLVIGDSPAAAQAVTQWLQLEGRGSLVWAVPQTLGPDGLYPTMSPDPLPARAKLFAAANEAVMKSHRPSRMDTTSDGKTLVTPARGQVTTLVNTNLTAIHWDSEQKRFRVRLLQWFEVDWDAAPDDYEEPDDLEINLEFEQVIVAVGHSVEESWSRELIVPRCAQSEALLSFVGPLSEFQGDRLDFKFADPRWMLTPEGRFFVLGAKSFGRLPNYFYRLGLQQVREAYRWIVGRATLDLEQTLCG
ncbi:MAG: hypothetical protein JNL67_10995 [Planctomycetaceae bacterium]|nr:hypothetical protein [Planctomycetaceae bacterium]